MPSARNHPAAPSSGAFAAVVLAGGSSSRMGRDKALLPLAGSPLLHRQLSIALAAGAAMVFISGRRTTDYAPFTCPVVYDAVEGAGPLAGLAAALHAVRESHAWLLVLAVDLPNMTATYLHQLAAEALRASRGLVPKRGPFFEPLAAVYPVAPTLAIVESNLAAKNYALQSLVESLVNHGLVHPLPITDHDRLLFANWNDPSGPQMKKSI